MFKECVCVYIYMYTHIYILTESFCCTAELTQYRKSTILQVKIK